VYEQGLTVSGPLETPASATHSTVLPHWADGCIARMIRNPNGAGLTSDVVLLLLWDLRLLVCHVRREVAHHERTTGLEIDGCELSV
jgi:hypothetical protein